MEYAVMLGTVGCRKEDSSSVCLGWLDELVASHAGSRPLLSTACDTARADQP